MLFEDQKKERNRGIESTWESIQKGTFVDEYAKDMRTSLQKAIDRNEQNIRVERKKDIEDGDLRMFDGKEWVQFCIHKAKKLINEDRIFVTTQERMSGIWVCHSDKHTKIFNNSLDENPQKGELRDVHSEYMASNGRGISYEKPINHPVYGYESERTWWKKMIDHDKSEAESEGDYSHTPNKRRFV